MHRHQKELEDSIEKIEGLCIELELQLLELTGTRQHVFERALKRIMILQSAKGKSLKKP